MREHTTCLVSFAFLFASAIQGGEMMNPIERRMRDRFPSVALATAATLESAQELVEGRAISGMRGEPDGLRIFRLRDNGEEER